MPTLVDNSITCSKRFYYYPYEPLKFSIGMKHIWSISSLFLQFRSTEVKRISFSSPWLYTLCAIHSPTICQSESGTNEGYCEEYMGSLFCICSRTGNENHDSRGLLYLSPTAERDMWGTCANYHILVLWGRIWDNKGKVKCNAHPTLTSPLEYVLSPSSCIYMSILVP